MYAMLFDKDTSTCTYMYEPRKTSLTPYICFMLLTPFPLCIYAYLHNIFSSCSWTERSCEKLHSFIAMHAVSVLAGS